MQVGERVVLIRDVKELKKGMEGTINELPVFNKFYTVNFGELGIYYMDCESMKIIEEAKSALQTQEGGDHYRKMEIQPIQYIHANKLPFAEGCIIKYVSRWRSKNGIKDLEKARHFIDLLIELECRDKP